MNPSPFAQNVVDLSDDFWGRVEVSYSKAPGFMRQTIGVISQKQDAGMPRPAVGRRSRAANDPAIRENLLLRPPPQPIHRVPRHPVRAVAHLMAMNLDIASAMSATFSSIWLLSFPSRNREAHSSMHPRTMSTPTLRLADERAEI